jgi:hypothetical protein
MDCCYARKFKFKCAFNNHMHFVLELEFQIGKNTTFIAKQKRWVSLFTHMHRKPTKIFYPDFSFSQGISFCTLPAHHTLPLATPLYLFQRNA